MTITVLAIFCILYIVMPFAFLFKVIIIITLHPVCIPKFYIISLVITISVLIPYLLFLLLFLMTAINSFTCLLSSMYTLLLHLVLLYFYLTPLFYKIPFSAFHYFIFCNFISIFVFYIPHSSSILAILKFCKKPFYNSRFASLFKHFIIYSLCTQVYFKIFLLSLIFNCSLVFHHLLSILYFQLCFCIFVNCLVHELCVCYY